MSLDFNSAVEENGRTIDDSFSMLAHWQVEKFDKLAERLTTEGLVEVYHQDDADGVTTQYAKITHTLNELRKYLGQLQTDVDKIFKVYTEE